MTRVGPGLLRQRLGRLCVWSRAGEVVHRNVGSACGGEVPVPIGQEGKCTCPRKQLMVTAMQVGSKGLYKELIDSKVVFPDQREQRRLEGWYHDRAILNERQCTVVRLEFETQVF